MPGEGETEGQKPANEQTNAGQDGKPAGSSTGDASGSSAGTTGANGAGTNSGKEEPKFTQSELEHHIEIRLTREREAAAAKAKKADEEAEAKRLKDQAEWKTLSETHEAKVSELTPQLEQMTAQRDKLSEIVKAQMDAEIKDWPKEVLDILPAPEADLLVRYDAIAKARGLAASLAGKKTPGNVAGPKPNGGTGTQTAEEQMRQTVSSFQHGRF